MTRMTDWPAPEQIDELATRLHGLSALARRAPVEQLAHVPSDLLVAYLCQAGDILGLMRRASDDGAEPASLWNAFEAMTGHLETACDIMSRVQRPEAVQAA